MACLLPAAAACLPRVFRVAKQALVKVSYSMQKNKKHGHMPRGFHFATAEAAIKKPGRKDIALIVSGTEAHMAGMFTTNTVKAAPVQICMEKIRSGRGQAIIINSGNANACTGTRGRKDAESIIAAVAKDLALRPSLVYPCSTGVIGTPMPLQRIMSVVPHLTADLGSASLEDAAKAIMTTDTFPKMVIRKVKIGSRTGTIAGICKGAGMIAPKMATMLCFVITDIDLDRKALDTALKSAVNRSFNRITIDGDMSTNDTVLMMANGMLGNDPLSARNTAFDLFRNKLEELTYELSRLIVKDGEGASKLVEVIVRNASSEPDAEKAAYAIANSNLVKTAIYGNDANWGRIMAAAGYSKARFNPGKADIFFNRVQVVKKGITNNRDSQAAEEIKKKTLKIIVDLHAGKASAKVLTCDFSEDYVRINAEYRT